VGGGGRRREEVERRLAAVSHPWSVARRLRQSVPECNMSEDCVEC
jgi:hypothetical protein